MINLTIIDISILFIYFLQGLTSSFFYYYLLTPKYSFKKTILIFSFSLLVCSIITYNNLYNLLFRQFLYYIVYLTLCAILYSDSWKMRFFVFFLMLVMMFFIDWIIMLLFYQILFREYSGYPQGLFLLYGSLLYEILYALSVHIFLILWNRKKKNVLIKSIYLTMLFPISQAILVHSIIYYVSFEIIYNRVYTIPTFSISAGCIVSTIADIILFQIILSNSQKEYLASQLQLLNQQAYRELQYYRSMNEKILQMRKIRHDFNNQLQTAYGIFLQHSSESPKEACAFLIQLENRLNAEPTPICYCRNMIVNVILEEKARKAKMLGISFETDVSLPEELSIEMIDLCSIFSNLLDNAIESIGVSKEIRVLSYLRSGYCMVQVINSITDKNLKPFQHQKDREFHGYGMPILHSIAEKYHGEFITFTENGFFTANMKLRI
ncbi:MAG: GHKL domain-containing protein [Lachnospiraceae bacterium]|nr:GHKL domain-containing protein [Lachnospiraceae bacterium]